MATKEKVVMEGSRMRRGCVGTEVRTKRVGGD